jgi:Rrf2 family protein
VLSKTAKNATHAVVYLAGLKPGEFAGAVQVARQIGAPPNYLGKLLKLLAAEGLVESQKGFGGGFRLARPAKRLSLYDIVEPIDHVSKLNGCLLGDFCNERNPCAVHHHWRRIGRQFLAFLKETTVEDILTHGETKK